MKINLCAGVIALLALPVSMKADILFAGSGTSEKHYPREGNGDIQAPRFTLIDDRLHVTYIMNPPTAYAHAESWRLFQEDRSRLSYTPVIDIRLTGYSGQGSNTATLRWEMEVRGEFELEGHTSVSMEINGYIGGTTYTTFTDKEALTSSSKQKRDWLTKVAQGSFQVGPGFSYEPSFGPILKAFSTGWAEAWNRWEYGRIELWLENPPPGTPPDIPPDIPPGTPAVPEPSTLALSLGGLTLCALAARQRYRARTLARR